MAARRRWPRPVRGRKGERGRTRVPGKKTKKRTEGTHSGGHQWSMAGLPVAVFLHNRFSGLPSFSFFLFSSSSHSGYHPPRLQRSSLFWTGWPPKVSPREAPSASSRHCLYLPAPVTHTSPAHAVRGGLYLNNIHELRYTRQIYYPGTRGFCEDPKPTPPRLPPFFSRVPPFLMLPLCSASFVFLFLGITLRLLARAINPVCFYPPCSKRISTLTKFWIAFRIERVMISRKMWKKYNCMCFLRSMKLRMECRYTQWNFDILNLADYFFNMH